MRLNRQIFCQISLYAFNCHHVSQEPQSGTITEFMLTLLFKAETLIASILGGKCPAMRHDDAKLPILWGRTATDVSLSDLENRGGLYEILESIITDNRHVYSVTTRQKQQLVQFA